MVNNGERIVSGFMLTMSFNKSAGAASAPK
jgi:hypothetical protein